jgi:hypothetical protein
MTANVNKRTLVVLGEKLMDDCKIGSTIGTDMGRRNFAHKPDIVRLVSRPLGLLGVGFIIASAVIASMLSYWLIERVRWENRIQRTLLPRFEQELGFTLGEAIVDGREVMSIGSVQAGGVMQQSGFLCGDLLPDYRSIGQLCIDIENARGKSFAVNVIETGSTVLESQCVIRTKSFVVPPSSLQ